MIESLRRFGGRFADVPVIVVTPRIGPPLADKTQRRLRQLGVRYLRIRPETRYVWHHYMNKGQAVKAADRIAETDSILWMDSDLLFLGEPSDIERPRGIDFLASAPDTGLIGSHGGDDPHDAFWSRCAALVGLDVDQLPWVTTADGHRIRFYWNSGMFLYRRGTDLGREYADDLERAMVAGVARTHDQVHFIDQAILGMTVLRLGLSWQAIPETSNVPVTRFLPESFDPAKLRPVEVLHYHDSMAPDMWPRLLATLAESHPEVHEWLSPMGPIVDPATRAWGLVREGLRIMRGLERRRYYARNGFTKGMQTVR